MYDGYYDREIERCQKELKMYALGMDVSIKFLDIKNERVKEKLQDRAYKIRSADIEKAGKLKEKFNNELKKITQTKITLYTKVEDVIEQQKIRYDKDLDYDKIHDIAKIISENPVSALKFYTSQYIETKKQIEKLKKAKIEDAKMQAESLREEENKNVDRLGTDYTYTPTYDYSYTSYDEPVRSKPRPYSGMNNEESKKLVEAMIDKEIADKYGYVSLSYDEEQRIKELYPELNNYEGYYSVDTLKDGIKIENIMNKKDIKVEEIMNLGLLTIHVVAKELLQGNKIAEPKLFSKLNMKGNLEKYKKAYDKFMNYYNKLSPKEKEAVSKQIESNERYVNIFGKRIANPEHLTNIINKAVINHIKNNYIEFYGYNNDDYFSKTLHAAKYMSVEDIVELYNGIKLEAEKYPIYGRDEAEAKRMQEAHREFLAKLQRDFANVILTKLNQSNKSDKTHNMSEEELLKHIKNENEKVAAIIIDLFKETPIAEDLQRIANEKNLEGKGTNINETHKIKQEVETRIYNLSPVKKAFIQMTREWNRYLMLREKEELTEKEQEELKGMFK